MHSEHADSKKPLYIAIVFLLVLILGELASILFLNNNFFVYTLDDAYIHLALGENLQDGHYGVNKGESSAPSSSILWPFIVAPFASFAYFPLILNVVASILTVAVFMRILEASLPVRHKDMKATCLSAFLIGLILATNLIGLTFMGMEHSLQVLLVTLIAFGLIIEINTNKAEYWLLAAIIIAPLIRYENLAISLPAIGYLSMRRYYKEAVWTSVILIALIGAFSLFLAQIGLHPLPTSILAKTSIADGGLPLWDLITNLRRSLAQPKGLLLYLGALGLLAYVFFSGDNSKKILLAILTIASMAMHILAGNYGWYNRYEVYIWAFFLSIIIYLLGPQIARLLEARSREKNLVKLLIVLVGFVLTTSPGYIKGLITLPIASNNIYEQHYQMHRFATEYYKGPVAVNDLGYVSYNNSNYVLDLWGLASLDALAYRRRDQDSQWMKALARSHDIKLAMIYEDWFTKIPDNWIKIGNLHLGNRLITASRSKVAFYAMTPKAYKDIVAKLKPFVETLPPNVTFTFEELAPDLIQKLNGKTDKNHPVSGT